jgi:hypothetical protein
VQRGPCCYSAESNSSEPLAGADTRSGNCHTCDIHFANSAFVSLKEKALERAGTNLLDESCQLSAVERTFAVLLERESALVEKPGFPGFFFWPYELANIALGMVP